MEIELSELEKEFRADWDTFDPQRMKQFLGRAANRDRMELLARLVSAELEFLYSPPVKSAVDEDDERARPNLHLFVAQFPELVAHKDIFFRLSVLEYALRLKHESESPNPEAYVALCEDSQDRLLHLLRLTEVTLPGHRARTEPVAGGVSDSTVKDATERSIALDPLPNNLGCFLMLREIGVGGMGYVHSAIDLRSTAPVAVKVMRRNDPWSISRFIEEFSWLSQLNHPNLVKLYDAFAEGDLRYFSMELVEGRTVRHWYQRRMKRAGKKSESQLWPVLGQAASAIHFLHEHGVLHCDIKSSNLMITSRGRAVLLDLGLAAREGYSQPGVGTLQYMAPEVALGDDHTRASDWYSFGLLMYEVLAQEQFPNLIEKASDQLDARSEVDLDLLRHKLAGVEPSMVELCCELLNSDPQQRPPGDSIVSRLGGHRLDEDVYSLFAGRTAELETLNRLRAEATHSQIRFIQIRGESGIGKTTLLQQWIKQLDRSDLLLHVRCFRQDHTPLRLLNHLVQELVLLLGVLPKSGWWPLLEPYFEDIQQAFPQVQRVVDQGYSIRANRTATTTGVNLRAKGMQQLAKCLTDLSAGRRFLIVIDDATWADVESFRWLADLVGNSDFHGLAVAVDQGPGSQVETVLRAHDPHREKTQSLELGPLDDVACEELVSHWSEKLAIDLPSTVVENLTGRSGGSPFLLQEFFRTLAHYAKRDRITGDQWLYIDSDNSVRRRFGLLPAQSEVILQYLSVAEQPLGFHQLKAASRIAAEDLQRTLNLLSSQGWIRSGSKALESEIEVAHEKIRGAVLKSMSSDRLQRRHYRMAQMLSRESPPAWSRMGYHYASAERHSKAAACFLEAARGALKEYAFADACTLLEQAEHRDADRSPSEKEAVTRLKAIALAGHGDARAAAEVYDQLAANSQSDEERHRYRCLAGEQWVRAGKLDESLERLRPALEKRGVGDYRKSMVPSGWLRVRTMLRAVRHRKPKPSTNPDQAFDEFERCLLRTSFPMTFLDNQLGPDLILALNRAAETHGTEADKAVAGLNWAILLSLNPRRWRSSAIAWIRHARRLARKSGEPDALGAAELTMQVWQIQRGNNRPAIRHAKRAIHWFSLEPGDRQWELHFLKWAVLGCYWDLMDFVELRRRAEELRETAENRCMAEFFTNIGGPHWADLVSGNVQRGRQGLATASEAISGHSFQTPRFFLWISRIQQALYERYPAEAHEILMRDWGQLAKAYVLGNNHFRWQAFMLRLACNLACLRENVGNAKLLKRDARWSVKQMLKLEEPVFIAHGRAFGLLLSVLDGEIPADHQWEEVIQYLHQKNQHLYASALEWHHSLCQSGEQGLKKRDEVRQRFLDQGVPDPERLLEIVLPLPGWSETQ